MMLRTEVAEFARCTTRTVQRAEALGLLRAARKGAGSTRTLYRREDVLAWLGIAQ
jgi:DNA-binding transcriptional MerR regulator